MEICSSPIKAVSLPVHLGILKYSGSVGSAMKPVVLAMVLRIPTAWLVLQACSIYLQSSAVSLYANQAPTVQVTNVIPAMVSAPLVTDPISRTV